jgi:hypothetical protein
MAPTLTPKVYPRLWEMSSVTVDISLAFYRDSGNAPKKVIASDEDGCLT